jgi:oligosaccharide repeat unit polymerase
VLYAVLLLYFAAVVSTSVLFARREGYYSTITVFGIACFIYYVSIPAELFVAGTARYALAGSEAVIAKPDQTLIIVLATLAFLAFAMGYGAARLRIEGPPEESRDVRPWPLVALAVVPALMIALFFRSQVAAAGTYVGNVSANATNPAYAFLQRIALFGIAGLAAGLLIARNGRRLVAVILFVLLVAWGVYASNKDPIILGLLSLASTRLGTRSRRIRWGFLVWGMALVASAIGPIAFSRFRAGASIPLGDLVVQYGIFRQTDPAGPMMSLAGAVERPPEYRLGSTYLRTFVLWIPRSLWPGRPVDLAEDYARNQLQNWSPGRGLGYSLLAESYLNFGIVGPILQYFAIGWLWGMFWRVVRRYARLSDAYFRGLYGSVGFYLLIIMHRGATSSLVTPLVQLSVPLFLASVVAAVSNIALSSRRSSCGRAAQLTEQIVS